MIRSLNFALRNCSNKNIGFTTIAVSKPTTNSSSSLLFKNNFSTASAPAEIKVPTELVVQLRKKTQAPLQECKKALMASNNNMDGAISWLLERGKATAEKLKSRVSAEGVISVLVNNDKAIILEMNSETDFVSRGDIFRDLTRQITNATLSNSNIIKPSTITITKGIIEVEPTQIDQINPITFNSVNDDGNNEQITIKDSIIRIVSKLRENIYIRRASFILPTTTTTKSIISSYAHDASGKKDIGRLGSIVQLEYTGECNDIASLSKFGDQLAVHIVSNSPSVVSVEDIPSEQLEECKANNKKPESLYEDLVLLEQPFINSTSHTVKEYMNELSSKLGTSSLSVKTFRRYAIGETAERV